MPKSRGKKDLLDAVPHCFYCEREFNSPHHHKNCGYKTIDHIIPIIAGGKNIQENMVVACSWCNNKKGAWELDVFYNKILKISTHPKKSQIFKNAGINLGLIMKNIMWLQKYVEPHKSFLCHSFKYIPCKMTHPPHLMKLIYKKEAPPHIPKTIVR